MIVGVTGGSGFIGSWICDELIKRGHTPYLLDHRTKNNNGMVGSVRDFTTVMEFAAHVDAIIHLAAVLGTSETIKSPLPAVETNVIGSVNVFEAASHYNLPVVYAAVGNANIGRGTYCITKSCGEQFVDMYREDRGLRVVSVRPVNAYGPRQSAPSPYGFSKVRKIVPSLICSALSGDPLLLYGGGSQYSDSVWVGDVARVFVVALENAKNGNVVDHPIDVGNVTPLTVLDVANEVKKNIPSAVIKSIPMRDGEPFGTPIDTPEALKAAVDSVTNVNPNIRRLDAQRAIRSLGNVVSADPDTLKAIGVDPQSFVTLEEGIKSTVDWFIQNEGLTWSKPLNA